MKNKKKLLLIFSIVCFIFIIFYFYYKSDFTLAINHNIRVASEANRYLYLSDITPFDWDEAFIIEDPYIGGEALDKLIGVKCNLKRSDFDSTRRIVFINDKKFVYDYMYKWSQIEFRPLGITVNKNSCKFIVEKTGSKKVLLKLSDVE